MVGMRVVDGISWKIGIVYEGIERMGWGDREDGMRGSWGWDEGIERMGWGNQEDGMRGLRRWNEGIERMGWGYRGEEKKKKKRKEWVKKGEKIGWGDTMVRWGDEWVEWYERMSFWMWEGIIWMRRNGWYEGLGWDEGNRWNKGSGWNEETNGLFDGRWMGCRVMFWADVGNDEMRWRKVGIRGKVGMRGRDGYLRWRMGGIIR